MITICLFAISCTKLIEIQPPLGSITTQEIFENDKQAEFAIAGLYSKMINSDAAIGPFTAENFFSAGLSTIAGGLSADELNTNSNYVGENVRDLAMMRNKIIPVVGSKSELLWTSAYKIIYHATAIIEGLEESNSNRLTAQAKSQFMGEALTIRSFAYFQLVNFYGEVPLVVHTNNSINMNAVKTSTQKVYDQIVSDLAHAITLLADDFNYSKGEKIRLNKWFAKALLSRTYLYTNRFDDAAATATEVIDQQHLFNLEEDITKVFLKNSKEAIFQLKPADEAKALSIVTPEGKTLSSILSVGGNVPLYNLSDELLNAFESGDKRKTSWVNASGNYFYASKYKNIVDNEYYTVMRLSEIHLIRAEAIARSNANNLQQAISDLNLLRQRASLPLLPTYISRSDLLESIYQERRIELFAEWGHRWFDLKRTGRAEQVLSIIPYKQDWWGAYQLLYPIPINDLMNNTQLTQNPEYDNQ